MKIAKTVFKLTGDHNKYVLIFTTEICYPDTDKKCASALSSKFFPMFSNRPTYKTKK